MLRLASLPHILMAFNNARGNDGLVRRYRMLVGSVLHWPLTLRGKGIVSLKVDPHAGESLGLHRRAILLKAVGRVARQAIIRCKLSTAFIAQLVVQSFGSAEHENVFPMVSIVDRHMPVNGVTIPTVEPPKAARLGMTKLR